MFARFKTDRRLGLAFITGSMVVLTIFSLDGSKASWDSMNKDAERWRKK